MATQNERLVDYLKKHNGITSFEAAVHLGIMRLSERVREVERRGVSIVKAPERAPNGARVVRYSLPVMP